MGEFGGLKYDSPREGREEPEHMPMLELGSGHGSQWRGSGF